MPRPLNIVKARNAVADAKALGDKAAAKRHGITTRTLRRWKGTVRALDADGPVDPFEMPPTSGAELNAEWRQVLRKVLKVGMTRLVKITGEEEDPEKLSRTLERIANVEVVAEALGVGGSSPSENCANRTPPEAEGKNGRGKSKKRSSRKRT